MKKIYIAPNTEIVNVKIENLLAIVSGGGETLTETLGETTTSTGGNLSRRGYDDFWDDEEEY
jgi:hypothetical protein